MTKHVDPTPGSPGDVLRREIIAAGGITQDALAAALRVSRFTVNQIVNGKRGVTADMALRLARVLDTTPQFWLSLQQEVDLHEAIRRNGSEISGLTPLRRSRRAEDRFATIEELVSD